MLVRRDGRVQERWQDAHQEERAFWSTGGLGLKRFRTTVHASMETAEWAGPRLQVPRAATG
jgi:hypothetical protein